MLCRPWDILIEERTMKQSEFTKEDLQVISRDFEDMMCSARKRCTDPSQLENIQRAFDLANSAHKGARRRSGEPYILHPIAVAKIVVEDIGLGWKSICAALLHDVVEDTSCTTEDIRNLFGDKIASLVDGLTKIKTVLDKEDKPQQVLSMQAENFRRILLTLNEDTRVVLIKLADRLHNCRTIGFMPESKREKILSETMYIFIPLAHRLGLYGIKSEMEDIWLRYKEPEAYKTITSQIQAATAGKEKLIDEFLAPIRESLDKNGIEYTIKKRIKTPYSIWNKIQTKHVTFEQISDLYAVRIIFKPSSLDLLQERNECFRVFALITAIYEYRPERVRDWVMHPKPNGYEALHLTAISKDGTNIEVQIRTVRMDEIAEKGISAHWNYKKIQPQTEESQMDKWIASIKEILQKSDINSLEMLDMIHNDMVGSEIYFFDNKGGQHNIAKGATALDYALQQDKEEGLHAIAAKINYHLHPLSYVIRSGDQVEIITSRTAEPKREWLSFVTTKTAVNIIKESLGIKDDTAKARHISGKYILADCCKPIPGDSVVGFVQDDNSIIIHKKSCPNADSLASKFGDKIVTPKWIVDTWATFPVRLQMNGIDRMGLFHEISEKISREHKISFKAININTKDGVFNGYIDIWVHDTETLDSVIDLLKHIGGIQAVSRAEIE